MKSNNSYIIIGVAALLGLFFGTALGGPVWALILAVVSAGGAFFTMRRYESGSASPDYKSHVEDPSFARFLFSDTRAAALWLPIRIFVGWEWLDAGWHKMTGAGSQWMTTGAEIRGFWDKAAAVPAPPARPSITYDWWRAFIQSLIDSNAQVWFGKAITIGEILVGLGLITGALVGIAASGGILMNMSFLLSGSSSSNPVMLVLAFALVLSWKTAGYFGLDRYLLRMLGTPWQPGTMVSRKLPAQITTTT